MKRVYCRYRLQDTSDDSIQGAYLYNIIVGISRLLLPVKEGTYMPMRIWWPLASFAHSNSAHQSHSPIWCRPDCICSVSVLLLFISLSLSLFLLIPRSNIIYQIYLLVLHTRMYSIFFLFIILHFYFSFFPLKHFWIEHSFSIRPEHSYRISRCTRACTQHNNKYMY